MKPRQAISLISISVLSVLALMIIAQFLAPQPALAQRLPTNTPFKPRPTRTRIVPTDTKTPSPTPLPPSFTPSITPTITPSPTATHTPTFTPTATATAFPTSVRLNELLSFAKFKDWNKDGRENNDDQWIELYNLGANPADVSGWRIDTGDQTPYFEIPKGAVIPAGGFIIFFRDQTKLDIDHYSHLRLLYPDGSISDQVIYPPLAEDRVYARSKDGSGLWRTGCVPTPISSNCQYAETYTSQFNLPFFKQHITSPDKQLDSQVLVTNILLAIILALAIGFFSNLLNDALETHEEDVAVLFGPVTRLFKKGRIAITSVNMILTHSRIRGLGFMIKFLGILLVYGFVLANLDPNFQFITQDGFLLIVALGLSTGFIALVDDLATYLILRWRGASGEIRFHSGNFLMVILSTLVSRVTGIVPGIFLGSPAGIEDVPHEHSGPYLDILAIVVTAASGLLAWLLVPVFSYDPWMNTLLLLMFAAGVQTVFFEMLPIAYLRGKGIFNFNPILWLSFFAVAATVFLQTMLNPDGVFLGAFTSKNMVVLSLFVLAYCVFCTLIWFWLTRLAQKRELEKTSIATTDD